jgi:peptide deformylase
LPILKVAQLGHPILRRVADPVDPAAITSDAFRSVYVDLLETMEDYEGAGLAAPQVHLSIRVVVLTLDEDRGPEIWINPVITPLTSETIESYEGCLSVEGMRARVSRPAKVHVHFLDIEANKRAYVLEGFPAVVAQHECDHLDGVIYLDRADPRTMSFMPQYRKFGPMHQYLDVMDDLGDLIDDPTEEVEIELNEPQDINVLDDADLINDTDSIDDSEDYWPDSVVMVDPEAAPELEM